MEERYLRLGFSFLLVTGITACGGAGGMLSAPAPGGAFNAPVLASQDHRSNIVPSATAAPTSTISIDAGGGAQAGRWLADTDYSPVGTSGVNNVSNAISMKGVTSPAPQAVYQTGRYAPSLTYTIPNLTPSASYTVRLHFAELWFKAAKQRVFSVTSNGVSELANFDIFAAAGGSDIAIVKQFVSSADATGKIAIKLDSSVNNALISGIEVTAAVASPAPTATPTPVVTASPIPIPSPRSTSFFKPTAVAAPRGVFNPDPTAFKVCTDPCHPVIDAKSATMNSAFFGSTPNLGHITPAAPGDATHMAYESIAMFEGTAANPKYTVHDISYPSRAPTGVHIPNGANADPSGTDYLFDVIDSVTGLETNGYHFNTGSASSKAGRILPISGGGIIYSWGLGQVANTCFAGNVNHCIGGSAGRIPQSLNELDPVDWLNQSIKHELHIVGGCESTATIVYPAGATGQGGGPSTCPPAGEILWLDKTDAQIEAMSQPRWVKTLYHNLHQYGWVPQDGNGGSQTGGGVGSLQITSDFSYTAIGEPSQWAIMFNEISAEGSGSRLVSCGGTCKQITFPVDSSISLSNLHWIQLLQQ